ncbi:MAG: hypothetical protein BWK80_43350 [Desulfobacteraceae bacterium IS3]|jgi:hypothetical protein|nr:MAG: hypothetical protein BWK80_43350 [Desulfobacteraceae bacterium IS3]HAO21352.1 XisI protein [Desulfobacteraceae bacterium]
MENMTEFYKTCVKRLLSAFQPLKTDCSEVELVFDDERMHYMAFRVGWRKHKRIHLCLVHIDICNDMIVIQANNTEDLIDAELIEMGIPKEKICLGLLPPDVRTYVVRHEQTRSESFFNHHIPIRQAA